MKYLIYCPIIAFAFFSCSKSSTTTPPPPVTHDSILKSFSVYEPQSHYNTVVVYGYNQLSQLATLHIINYDSSSGTPKTDSNVIVLTQTSTTTPPGAYDITFHTQGGPPAGLSEHHLLFYDNQDRIILDSTTVNTTTNYTATHFTYDGNGNTTIEWFTFDPLTPGSNTYLQIDTMNVPVKNMVSDIGYTSPGTGFKHLITRTFTTEINPMYNIALSNSLGSLISFNSLIDFRSNNLPAQMVNEDASMTSVTLNFVWTKDAYGRITQGTGKEPISGLDGQVYTFNY